MNGNSKVQSRDSRYQIRARLAARWIEKILLGLIGRKDKKGMKFWTQKEEPFRRMAVIVCLPDAIVSLSFVPIMLFIELPRAALNATVIPDVRSL
ncbi:MAG: hypothetical protein ABF991_09565 [Liquorilactobacillus hordei]|uniref:hypothetical protein n=1 Tax=Liquorilactobacillus hordei TaxID=468911 RepID=UPI0039E9CC19